MNEAKKVEEAKEKKPKEKKSPAPDLKKSLYQILSAPIPSEFLVSYTEDNREFTGYHAQYAIDLINEHVGLGNWDTEETILKQEMIGKAWFVAIKVDLLLLCNENGGHDIAVTGYGAAFAKNGANAYKGAKTSAFKNACRYLGIGRELYVKGFDEDISTTPSLPADNASVPEAKIENQAVYPAEETKTGAEDLINKIQEATTKEELEQVRNAVSQFEAGEAVKKLLLKKFNDKLISLS